MSEQDWVTSARIEGIRTISGINSKSLLLVLFWLWGIIGLMLNGLAFISLSTTIGVGTSAYLTVGLLYWIGGMVLFGLGAMIMPSSYDFKRPP